MPLKSWICSGCGGREVPLDHFATTPCGSRVHPDYAAAVLKSRESHYASGVVEVSHLLGCPRSYAIQQSEKWSVDPLELNAPETGTAWHSWMDQASVDPKMTEVVVAGLIEGVMVCGRVDRLHPPDTISDWKHGNDFTLKYIKRDGAKVNHQLQVSLYAELTEQTLGWRPKIGRLWYHGSVSGKDALTPITFDVMPLEEVLDARPSGGTFSVRDLLHQAQSAFVEKADWRTLPLAGVTQMFGDREACTYCSVRGICKEAESGAPF